MEDLKSLNHTHSDLQQKYFIIIYRPGKIFHNNYGVNYGVTYAGDKFVPRGLSSPTTILLTVLVGDPFGG